MFCFVVTYLPLYFLAVAKPDMGEGGLRVVDYVLRCIHNIQHTTHIITLTIIAILQYPPHPHPFAFSPYHTPPFSYD